jgi:hypothetical protein
MGTYDPVGYALAVNAFSRESVANPGAIPPTVCAQPFQPGVQSDRFASNYTGFLAEIGHAQESARQLSGEPRLACYVFARCRR